MSTLPTEQHVYFSCRLRIRACFRYPLLSSALQWSRGDRFRRLSAAPSSLASRYSFCKPGIICGKLFLRKRSLWEPRPDKRQFFSVLRSFGSGDSVLSTRLTEQHVYCRLVSSLILSILTESMLSLLPLPLRLQ